MGSLPFMSDSLGGIEKGDNSGCRFVLLARQQQVHRLRGEQRAIGIASVDLGLAQGLPSGDRHELVRRKSSCMPSDEIR